MKSLSYLNKYFLKYKWRLLLGILFISATNWFNVMKPAFFGKKTDELINMKSTESSDALMIALEFGGYYILLALISGFFLFLTRQTIIIMSRHIEYDLKNEIYAQYQRLSFTFYKMNSTGDLMNRISEDVSKVRMYLGPGVMYTINLAILSIFSIYNMVSISGILTLCVLLPLPIMSFIIYKVSSRINAISTTVQQEQSAMSTIVQETFSGIRVIKSYSKNNEVRSKFDRSADAYKLKSMRLVFVNSLFMPTIFVLIGISTILSIYIGGLLNHDEAITVGDIIQFIFYVNMLTWPFASIGWVISIIQSAAASQERINEFIRIKPEIVNVNTGDFDFKGAIEFRNVTYTYPNSGIVAIKDLSFKLKPGETIGVIGRTGSGKSTLISLLMRQIEPDSGEILIDGINLKDINLEQFREQTGVVLQDVFLFSDSIKNNLLFGSNAPDVPESELIEVCKKAHVYHNIEEFKHKLDTRLGERGVNLSGGQKQRISIARALIRNPKLLILDDCLSAVDTKTEEIILHNLKKQKTLASLIVSHRVSTIRNANYIICIDHGAMIEQGTHADLIAKNGFYKELFQKQLEEEDQA